jgi:hypothetical protein
MLSCGRIEVECPEERLRASLEQDKVKHTIYLGIKEELSRI